MTYGISIHTYRGVYRLERLLESLQKYCSEGLRYITQIHVVHDPPAPSVNGEDGDINNRYKCVINSFNMSIELHNQLKWGCIPVTTNKAMEVCTTDIVFLLSDDIMFTEDTIRDTIYFIENNPGINWGAIALPHWDAGWYPDNGSTGTYTEEKRSRMYNQSWYGLPIPPMYRYPTVIPCIHGSISVIKRSIWEQVGGFTLDHWSFDEDISMKIWLKTDSCVIAIPVFPIIHQGAGSPCPAEGEAKFKNVEESFAKAWDLPYTKDCRIIVSGPLTYKIAQETPIIIKKLLSAKYSLSNYKFTEYGVDTL